MIVDEEEVERNPRKVLQRENERVKGQSKEF